ncbi:hypothetical protein HGA88_02780 [Candidatus Roizmanbacteria bacterium]|nr:hypothetical protein [Candidatus Roizmanbacteria bacterium]
MFKVIPILSTFFRQLGLAIYFSAIHYDADLRTKTTTQQRFLIWAAIISGSVTLVIVLLLILGSVVTSLLKSAPY